MKETDVKLLAELLKNSKKSDREIGRVLRVSQPTVTRTRTNLEKKGVVQEYTVIPDLTKFGFELVAITTSRFKVPRDEKIMERRTVYMKKIPNVIFAGRATGMGKDAIVVSVHRDFTEYENFIETLRADWIDAAEDQESILISLKGFVAKPFSLKYLAEILKPQ